ncbi:purine nucleoside phosphorylase II [Legionella nautarum]|uniref:Uridine phosphorylase n=1 Tax=Legionella nautarum TaxID=45070 RepID=A0A0W0WK56_9GAMM|nr:nucleoside phosphorylase [Legionella nautarum]KTD32714.1 purine nucleoside phosphorylase II [Legionella nautarum]
MFDEASLILNPNGSIYHLALFPYEIADTIITVGDPERVADISKHFDKIECKRQNREFTTHTGYLNGKHISVISTGIGTDNIDICINELDALANIDLQSRTVKSTLKSLNIIRVGTSGSMQADIPVNSFLLARFALGFDNLLRYYQYTTPYQNEIDLQQAIHNHLDIFPANMQPYLVSGSDILADQFADTFISGITATCVGFYAPQGRQLRATIAFPDILNKLQSFRQQGIRITNFEMETSGIYALGRVLNHHCCSLSAIIVNRILGQKSNDIPRLMEKFIQKILEKLL